VDLVLVGLAGSRLVEAGVEAGLQVAVEGFPDRGYNPDGTLMSRSLPGALIESPEEVARHAVELLQTMQLDTLCLHGDHPNAAENARMLRRRWRRTGWRLLRYARNDEGLILRDHDQFISRGECDRFGFLRVGVDAVGFAHVVTFAHQAVTDGGLAASTRRLDDCIEIDQARPITT
jgi:hypothetical protein